MTRTDIANLALAKIGGTLVESIDSDPRLSMLFAQTQGLILRAHPWNFAERSVSLASVSASAPRPARFDNAFDLPADFARLVEISCSRAPLDPLEFKLADGMAWTNTATADLAYISSGPPVSDWPADFVEAFSTLLAHKLALSILQSSKVAAAMHAQYIHIDLPEAKAHDVADNPGAMHPQHRDPAATSPLVAARSRRYFDPRRSETPVDPPA